MFSKGTFQRYLHEINSTQRRLNDLYGQMAGQTGDPTTKNTLADFCRQIEGEAEVIRKILNDLNSET